MTGWTSRVLPCAYAFDKVVREETFSPKDTIYGDGTAEFPDNRLIQLLDQARNRMILGLENISNQNYVRETLDVCINYIWEKLNTGTWRDVKPVWRKAYSYACLLQSLALAHQAGLCNSRHDEESVTTGNVNVNKEQGFNYTPREFLKDAIAVCDKGLLMGKPIHDNILCKIATALQDALLHLMETSTHDAKDKSYRNYGIEARNPTTNDISETDTKATLRCEASIPRVQLPSVVEFYKRYMLEEKPVIITDGLTHWPAFSNQRWSLEYLKKIAGFRTVPVEIGSKYTEQDWTQKLITINQFITNYIENETSKEKGYLAQHELFDQIPELRKDILIPDYCFLTVDRELTDLNSPDAQNSQDTSQSLVDEDSTVIINAWFGPRGTVSPLHHDPYHNILAQVNGQKYIRLYSHIYSECVYPHDSRLLNNTSQVDVENPDIVKFPKFQSAPYYECILKEGEMLYIPPKWWHYVRSLDISFSVSFWWN